MLDTHGTCLYLDSDDEQTHADITAKRRAVALLVFCDHSLKRLKTTSLAHTQKESSASQELLKLLIAVSATHPHDDAFVDLAAAARSAIASTLGVMSAPGFVAGILTILKSGSIHVRIVPTDNASWLNYRISRHRPLHSSYWRSASAMSMSRLVVL